MSTQQYNPIEDEMRELASLLRETIKEDLNKYTEKEFIEHLLPMLMNQDAFDISGWSTIARGPYMWVSIRDNDDLEKEIFRIPPIIPTYKVPERGETFTIDTIGDRVENFQHMGPFAARQLHEDLINYGNTTRKKGMVDDEFAAWDYIYKTYIKDREISGTNNEKSTGLSGNSSLTFEEEEL